jgi:DNA polymerase III epsilon subunit-like protein
VIRRIRMIYTILDIETTGFSRENDDLLEVGYMQVNKQLEIIRSGSLYFYKPEYKIESQAQSIHKLTRSFLCKHEDEFDDNIVSLYTLMHQGILIGKNSNRFDIPYLEAFFRRNAFCLFPVTHKGLLDLQPYYGPKYKKWYETKTGLSTNKLGSLTELIEMIGLTQEQVQQQFREVFKGEERVQAHSALYDVYMTYLLLEYAIENYGMQI